MMLLLYMLSPLADMREEAATPGGLNEQVCSRLLRILCRGCLITALLVLVPIMSQAIRMLASSEHFRLAEQVRAACSTVL